MENSESYLKEKDYPVCSKCHKQMTLDDIDFNFRGNQNEYWICDSCSYGCIVKIRYGKEINRRYSETDI